MGLRREIIRGYQANIYSKKDRKNWNGIKHITNGKSIFSLDLNLWKQNSYGTFLTWEMQKILIASIYLWYYFMNLMHFINSVLLLSSYSSFSSPFRIQNIHSSFLAKITFNSFKSEAISIHNYGNFFGK